MKRKSVLVFFLISIQVLLGEELYVDEIGEADFIPIETEPSALHQEVENRVKRQVGKVEPSYAYDANDYDYNANDADQYESSGNGYHYDDLEDTYDTEDDEFDPDKVMPSRVVPSLVSPSFEDPGYGQMMTKQVTSQKSAFDLIKTSLYDEMEGSGQDDFDLASIQPTKVTEMVKETRLPELSATFTPDQIEPQQPVITESPPMVRYNQAPIVKKKLKKYAVINGRSLKIQIPEDCFWDPEDGNTRNLKVDVYEENNKPLRVPWLKYDPKLQTLFALPFDENGIGRYSFNIVATDSQGLNASNYLGKFTHSVEN